MGKAPFATAAAMIVALAAVPASAQDTGGDGAAEDAVEDLLGPDELEPIPAPQIGRRIEETFREMQDVAPRLRRQRNVKNIREALPAFTAEIERSMSQPALDHLDGLSPPRLLDLEQDWARIAGQLARWQSVLETRSSNIAEERQHVRRARRLWQLTKRAPREEPLPESQRSRIESLLDNIDRVDHRLDLRMNEVLETQGQLSDEGLRVSAILARIRSARQKARDDRAERDHEPLWTGGERLPGARPEPPIDEVLAEHQVSIGAFLVRDRSQIVLHALLFLALAAFLAFGRFRRGAVRAAQHPSALRALRSRPFASAALLALVATPLVYPYLPSIIRATALLLLIGPVVRLAPFLLPPPRKPVLAQLALVPVSLVVELGYAPGWLRRGLLLGLALGGVGLAGWLHVAKRRDARRVDRVTRIEHWLLRLVALPLAAAAYFDVVGYVERAAVWVDGTFTVIEMVLVLHFAVSLVSAMIVVAARHPWAMSFRTFRTRRGRATRVLVRAARWAGIGALIYFALIAYDVLDPLLASARLALRKSYEFGSIEVSVGDVLAFGAVIAGTFVVVRLVHFLLSHELLPHFEMGQGTEAAISLTVSYLLVALGVILAFGMAGVNPEQLALLGGALGVGIGFGLQNVVSNFVSGLILVAERPIKVGDIIQIEDLVGHVHRIGIRSSTVRSLSGAEVIVPNSQLISDQLINWTLSDQQRRMELVVGTAYRHDPSEVREVLERVVRTTPGLMSDPPPEVLCTGFGDSAIEFTIRFWTNDYIGAIRLQSVLSQRVYRALEEAGIEIPFPQRDLHVRSVEADLPPGDAAAPAENAS
ncbi:MAG TPA: mechanosensitive ion channel [Sandaracinaceae bacterium LLY-WYZ-13_1]|nr:mechanosensitive ion channel [Sandaracinaceae bacterium LLY-WYZ-13_1]